MYGYQGNQDTPEILERGTYVVTYDIPTRGTITLAFQNGLGRKNHGNVLLLITFMMIEAGLEVRDVALQNFPKDGDPNRHYLLLPKLGEQFILSYSILNLACKYVEPPPKISATSIGMI